jgi:hypothetical protein
VAVDDGVDAASPNAALLAQHRVARASGLATGDAVALDEALAGAGDGQRGVLGRYLTEQGVLPAGDAVANDALARALEDLRARGGSERLLVALPGAWLEVAPRPASSGHTNWNRRARYALEDFDSLPSVREALDVLRRHRPGHTA